MAAADVKRTASIYINDADAQRALKRLQEEAHALYPRTINEKLDEAATADRVETD